MQIFKILDQFILDDKKGIELLLSFYEDQIKNFVGDVSSFYYYLKNGLPYSLKYTEKELYKFLYTIIGCRGLDFNMRFLLIIELGLSDDKEINLDLLEEVVNYPLSKVLNSEINIDNINRIIFKTFDISDERVLRLIRKYINGNTILRGNKIFDVIDKIITNYYDHSQDLKKFILDIYFKENENSTQHLLYILYLYRSQFLDVLSPEICIIAQQKVEGDETLTDKLADFFINNIKIYERTLLPFLRWSYQNLSVERRRRNLHRLVDTQIRSNDQNVHLLDNNKTEFLSWLKDKSVDFDKDKDNDKDIIISIKNEIEDIAKQDTKIKRSLEFIDLNPTLLQVSKEINIYNHKGILEWKLINVYERILYVILNHKNSDILKIRLIEELQDMSGTCFSGHFNRLTNIFAGIEDGLIFVDENKELKKSIKINLQLIIDQADEKIQDAILLKGEEDLTDNIKDYIKNAANNMLEELKEDSKNENLTKLFYESVNEYFGSGIYL